MRTGDRAILSCGLAGTTILLAAGWFAALVAVPGCLDGSGSDPAINPFQDLPSIPMDGQPHALSYTIAPIGELTKDQVVRLKVEGTQVQTVLVLSQDPESDGAGVVAGGGPANAFFDYHVQVPGRYFVLVLFNPQSSDSANRATLTAGPGDATFAPPKTQAVLVVFEENYLTNPGLVDPESFTDEERQTLVDISPLVRDGIIARLRTIFADTPIQILQEGDPLPDAPVSRLMLSAAREMAEADSVFFDTVVPPLDSSHASCTDRVVFGEMLPRGTMIDPGNQVQNDEAAVYVGSFQGRGAECRTAAINSMNNIILGLSHTAAHEIGHLVGLYHVPLTDIMDRSPTQAFQRELTFGRGQVLIEGPSGSTILTNVTQDPAFYFQTAFSK